MEEAVVSPPGESINIWLHFLFDPQVVPLIPLVMPAHASVRETKRAICVNSGNVLIPGQLRLHLLDPTGKHVVKELPDFVAGEEAPLAAQGLLPRCDAFHVEVWIGDPAEAERQRTASADVAQAAAGRTGWRGQAGESESARQYREALRTAAPAHHVAPAGQAPAPRPPPETAASPPPAAQAAPPGGASSSPVAAAAAQQALERVPETAGKAAQPAGGSPSPVSAATALAFDRAHAASREAAQPMGASPSPGAATAPARAQAAGTETAAQGGGGWAAAQAVARTAWAPAPPASPAGAASYAGRTVPMSFAGAGPPAQAAWGGAPSGAARTVARPGWQAPSTGAAGFAPTAGSHAAGQAGWAAPSGVRATTPVRVRRRVWTQEMVEQLIADVNTYGMSFPKIIHEHGNSYPGHDNKSIRDKYEKHLMRSIDQGKRGGQGWYLTDQMVIDIMRAKAMYRSAVNTSQEGGPPTAGE